MAILLVDDNQISIDLQKTMIESYGLAVETAQSGKQALKLVKNNNYVLVFMDIHMPEMDGFETARQIRLFNKDVPIVALSAESFAQDDPRIVQSGINGALQKPLQLLALKEVLANHVALANDNHMQWRRKTDILFDKDELLSVLSGNRALIHILQQFLSVHINDGQQIEKLIKDNNKTEAIAMLTNLVGIAGNLYCCRLYEAASRLIAELRVGVVTEEKIDIFSAVWKQTVGKLSECCNELICQYKPDADSDADWQTIWADFCDLCKLFDMSATRLFNDNVKIFESNLSKSNFEWLKTMVNKYDYLSISQWLEECDV